MPLDPLSDDDEPFGAPLPPDDRLWRHPSEVGGIVRAATRTRQVSTLRILALTLAGGLVGSLLTVGTLAGTGAFKRDLVEVTSPGLATAVANFDTVPPTAPGEAPKWTEAVRRIEPSLARLESSTPSGTLTGSAVAFRVEGTSTYLVTSADLLHQVDAVAVVLSGNKRRKAEIVAVDQYTNVGVVKVADERMPLPGMRPTAPLQGGADALVVAAPVRSATSAAAARALVSGLNSELQLRNGTVLQGLIRTDAFLTSAAKGGALLDASGSLSGIVTAMGEDETGVERFGYVLPVDVVRSTAENLVDTGFPTRVWLGIQGANVSPDVAEAIGIPGGAVISGVVPGGPAQQAQCQLAKDDVVIQLDNTPVGAMTALVMALRQRRPNDVVTLTYMRGTEQRLCVVTLTNPPDGRTLPTTPPTTAATTAAIPPAPAPGAPTATTAVPVAPAPGPGGGPTTTVAVSPAVTVAAAVASATS